MRRLFLSALFNAIIVGIMAEKCTKSDETEKELLEVVLNLAKENPDAPVVKVQLQLFSIVLLIFVGVVLANPPLLLDE